jgi:hypothetical protein
MQALVNKLSFIMDKLSKEIKQFAYKLNEKELKNLKNKQNGVIVFVDENDTSVICPKCVNKLKRKKNNGQDWLFHIKKEDCDFEIKKSE